MSLITKWIESLAETVEINETCLRKISPFSKCTKCINVCNDDAISFKNGQPITKGKQSFGVLLVG